MKTLGNVYRFLVNPDYNQLDGGFQKKTLELIRLFLTNLIIVLLITIPIGILRLYFNIHPKGLNLPIFPFLIINVLLIPIIEETAFRLSLIYSKINFCISLLFIFFFIVSYIMSGAIITTDKLLLRIFIPIAASSILYLLLNFGSINNIIETFWERNFSIILYFSLTLFVLRHLDEYAFSFRVLVVLLIILIPKFVTGVFLSYSRIRLGFIYGVILHIIINATSMGLIFFTS